MAGARKSPRTGGAYRPTPGGTQRSSTDWRWLLPFLILVVAGVVVALAASGDDQPPIPTYVPEPDPTTPAPTQEPSEREPTEKPSVDERPAPFGTVRGLALTDKGLILGAEDGAWRLDPEGGKPERTGGPRHRFSSLVRGSGGRLLASGLKASGDSPLGLAASDDHGKTWTAVSLDGQALFGHLRALGTRVYGWDAGTSGLMVSEDLRTWDTRSVEQRLLDFAIDPADPLRWVRAVPEGGVGLPEVQLSTDGGRNWKRIAAPSLFLFSWRSSDRLWALTEDGTIFRSADAGHSWSPRNILPAPPTAVLDTGDALYVALQTVGVYRSADDARSWQRVDQS